MKNKNKQIPSKTEKKEINTNKVARRLTTAPSKDGSVDGFITQAIANNTPVETMEKLFALREKVKAEQAKEAFTLALAQFQSECPVIHKTKKVMNKDGKSVRYQYAPLESIVLSVRNALTKNGLSYTINAENKDDKIEATAKITHILGHSETSSFAVPIDKEGFMSTPQKYASALTFAKRYAFTNALGILTAEEDTDASDVDKEPDAKSDKSKIIFLLRKLEYKAEKKEDIEKVVKEATQLKLEEKNFSEIVGRLEILVSEKEEYDHENNTIS